MAPTDTLLSAQAEALTHDQRIDSLGLDPVRRGVPTLPVADSIVSARAQLTIDGASTVTIELHDPEWLVENSGILNSQDGRLEAIDITVDRLRFRLVQATRRDPDTVTLVFEDQAVAYLRQHRKRKSASRGSMTRAQFVESMVREVKARKLEFYSPEKGVKQKVAAPEYPDAAPSRGETGFDSGVKLKVKGQRADAEQLRQMATVLNVCEQEGAGEKATLAAMVAAIGESEFRAIKNRGGSPYSGVFQAHPDNIPMRDTEQQARSFLRGGKGFQSGGAMAAAREHPDWSVGTIAYKVEGSRANFASDAAAEQHYQQHRDEGKAIIAAYNGGGSDRAGDAEAVTFKQYRFTRGEPGKPESSWDAGLRLAEQVRWRFFAAGGVIYFVSDDWLISRPASLVIEGPKDDGLLEPPTYDWHSGKVAGEVTLAAVANRWGVRPGSAVVLRNMGPVTGRWIVHTVDQDLLDVTDTSVTLIKPMPARKEPSPTATTVSSGDSGDETAGTGGAAQALKWARGKLGHFKEEWGSNRGDELDDLEAKFNFKGAPWCAMFATTALVQGGVSRDCRTASVPQINEWCQAGTHGYQQGFKKTPRAGDLMTFGGDHVALVEKVNGDSVTTIEGNTSAGKVARLTRLASSGTFVRPEYP